MVLGARGVSRYEFVVFDFVVGGEGLGGGDLLASEGRLGAWC